MATSSTYTTPRAVRTLLHHSTIRSYSQTTCNACGRGVRASSLALNLQAQAPSPSPRQQRRQPLFWHRTFTTTPATHKKTSASSKSNRKSPTVSSSDRHSHVPDNKHSRNVDAEPDPYDHSELQSAIDTAITKLREALIKTRDAGRVSADMIENLPVELHIKEDGGGSAGQAHKEKAKLGDIASVVAKGGRMMQVYAAEEAHVKALTSAIHSSSYSLTPQVDAHNPLLLNVPVPPATSETRQQAVAEAKKCLDKAALDVRNARGDAQKRFRKMELAKLVVVDELKKAHKGMEDVAKKGQDEVKKVYDNAVRALQNQ